MHSDHIKTLIVEDEPSASQNLVNLLKQHSPQVDVLEICETVNEGIEAINNHRPELVLLDIQLGSKTSFELLDQVAYRDFHIVFITAYNEYAVKAFQFSAVDYILKPINPIRLKESMQKVKKQVQTKNVSSMLSVLMDNLSPNTKPKKIVLSTSEMVHVIELQNIIKCQSSVNYTVFYLSDGKELIISKTLKEFDDQLSGRGFFRVHRSWLINEEHIAGYDKREGGYVVMKDQSKLPVSPKKKEELIMLIKQKN
ncbi:MAG: LytTR family DNA-binding domain-containing protein [Bacteroidota bacterium]